MAEIFISYKSDRRNAAKHLAGVLTRYGYSVWFDYGLIKGDDFDFQLDRQLRDAKAVIVLWCSMSVESAWVSREASLSAKLKTLLPVLIEDCELKLAYHTADYVDLIKWDGSPRSYMLDPLLRAVTRLVGREPQANWAELSKYEEDWRMFGSPTLAAFALGKPVEPATQGTEWGLIALAAREWPSVRDSNDVSKLQRFEKHFAGTWYADEARELRQALETAKNRQELLRVSKEAGRPEGKPNVAPAAFAGPPPPAQHESSAEPVGLLPSKAESNKPRGARSEMLKWIASHWRQRLFPQRRAMAAAADQSPRTHIYTKRQWWIATFCLAVILCSSAVPNLVAAFLGVGARGVTATPLLVSAIAAVLQILAVLLFASQTVQSVSDRIALALALVLGWFAALPASFAAKVMTDRFQKLAKVTLIARDVDSVSVLQTLELAPVMSLIGILAVLCYLWRPLWLRLLVSVVIVLALIAARYFVFVVAIGSTSPTVIIPLVAAIPVAVLLCGLLLVVGWSKTSIRRYWMACLAGVPVWLLLSALAVGLGVYDDDHAKIFPVESYIIFPFLVLPILIAWAGLRASAAPANKPV
jgi:hypothetical protein